MQTTLRIHPSLLILIAVLVGAAACSRAQTEPAAEAAAPAVPVRTAVVETHDLKETLALTGTLNPRAQVPVVAEVSARLLKVLRNEGDRVRQGELLAVLDDIDFRLARDRAKAMLDLAEANRVHALAEKDRADSLLKTGGITDKDRLAAQVAVQVAEASAAQARTELAIAEQEVARCQVKAPIGGRIARRSADAGTMLATGIQIYSIVDDAVYEFRAAVSSADFGKVKLGEPVTVPWTRCRVFRRVERSIGSHRSWIPETDRSMWSSACPASRSSCRACSRAPRSRCARCRGALPSHPPRWCATGRTLAAPRSSLS